MAYNTTIFGQMIHFISRLDFELSISIMVIIEFANFSVGISSYFFCSDNLVNKSQAAKSIAIPKGSYFAIDRGYHDFQQYNVYINNNIRFVTRMKTNAKYHVLETYQTNSDSPVTSDKIIEFT